jgi:GNAT superfamily N-acetyltransferase
MQEIGQFDPKSVDTWCREDMACLLGFLARRSFVEDMRMWLSELDLSAYDPGRFADRVPSAEAQGVQLRTLAELGAADVAVHRKLYDLWAEVRQDVPLAPGDVRSHLGFEEWWSDVDRPQMLPTGFFVALDGEEYVGSTQLWLSPGEPDVLRTGLTAVRRTHRRRGIALALKTRALELAKSWGYQRVFTDNEVNNRAMLSINEQLGFTKHPAWVHFIRSFGP